LDRTSMALSVEGRVPFLNTALVESALRLPEVIRAPDGQQKWLERKIAAKHLPEDLLYAPKQGFASPVPAWMHGGLAESARHLLTRPASLDRGWWSIDGVNEMLRDPMRYAYPLYALIMLELTTLIFVENDLSTSPPAFSMSEMCDV
jgi:asparagine synthase (glutamine-hydrolysing)